MALCKRVSVGYTALMAGKDTGLRIRVERSLRDDFLEVCRSQDRPAAQVLRELMRAYVTGQAVPDLSERVGGQSGPKTHVEGGTVGKKTNYRRTRSDS